MRWPLFFRLVSTLALHLEHLPPSAFRVLHTRNPHEMVFFLLTVPKRSISLQDHGQNDVYFQGIQFELEEKPPTRVD